jgi:hypothetical protein
VADSGTTTTIVTAVLAGGGTGVVGVVLTGLFGRKKTGADTAAVLLQAGAGQVISQAAQLERQALQLTRQDEQIQELQRSMDLMIKRGREHTNWDYQVMDQLRAANITVPPPPLLGLDSEPEAAPHS